MCVCVCAMFKYNSSIFVTFDMENDAKFNVQHQEMEMDDHYKF